LAKHTACMGVTRANTKFWSKNLYGRNKSEELGVNGRVILQRILGEMSGKVWTGFIWLRLLTSDWLW